MSVSRTALDTFWSSPIGQSIVVAKRTAAAAMRLPAYSDEQRAALVAFDRSPVGASIASERREVLLALNTMRTTMALGVLADARRRFCAAGGDCSTPWPQPRPGPDSTPPSA